MAGLVGGSNRKAESVTVMVLATPSRVPAKLSAIDMSTAHPNSIYTKDNPFLARLTENRLLNKPGSRKETRHFVVNLAGSDLHYKAGDSLGVFPSNRPSEVAEILQRLGATGDELVSPAMLKLPAPISFREALSNRLALAKPTRKILETLASKATAPEEKDRLASLVSPEGKDQLVGYLEDREFVDLLVEFPSAKLTPQEFVDHLRRLMPRLYSVASSSRAHPQEVHLTVAIVRYETNHRSRVGVASTFLADRVILNDTPVPVFVSDSHFGVPENGAIDIIMVGPGTGVAPFRAFMQERLATAASGRNWLFYGDQHRGTDYLTRKSGTPGRLRGNWRGLIWRFPVISYLRFTFRIACAKTRQSCGVGSRVARISTSAETRNGWRRTWIRRCIKSSATRAGWMPRRRLSTSNK